MSPWLLKNREQTNSAANILYTLFEPSLYYRWQGESCCDWYSDTEEKFSKSPGKMVGEESRAENKEREATVKWVGGFNYL